MRISDWSSDVCSSDLAQAPIDTQTFFRVSRNLKLLMADEFCGFTRSPCPIGTFEMMCEGTVSGGQLGATLQRAFAFYATQRSEERRVGKEGVSTCRSRWSPCL